MNVSNIAKYLTTGGVIVILISATIIVYGLYKKKWETILDALRHSFKIAVAGILVSAAGILLTYIGNYDIYINSYLSTILGGYILTLCLLRLFRLF